MRQGPVPCFKELFHGAGQIFLMNIIKVTQADIDRGGKMCNDCPIALAMQRHGYIQPLVGGVWTQFNVIGDLRDDKRTVKTPKDARSFIYNFDTRGKRAVAPFAFDLFSEHP